MEVLIDFITVKEKINFLKLFFFKLHKNENAEKYMKKIENKTL